MRLAISNIGWDAEEEGTVLPILFTSGARGVEIAPTKLWPHWQGASIEAAAEARRRYEEFGLYIPAIQSLLYERPDLCLFSDVKGALALRKHLVLVGRIAQAFGARSLVFGSPKNRDRGALEPERAMEEAANFFRTVGSDFSELGVSLCIEPNPTAYQCNFVTHWTEAVELVNRVASPGFGLHLDVACMALAGDDPIVAIRECGETLRHFHISEPQLADFTSTTIDHMRVGAALRQSGYEGWVSIEMRKQKDSVSSLREAIQHAKRCYL